MIEWNSLKFVVKFVIHIVVGTVLFALVAAVAVYLHKFMDYLLLGTTSVAYISNAVQGVEVFLFAVDLVCLIVFLIKEALILLRELWGDIRRPPSH